MIDIFFTMKYDLHCFCGEREDMKHVYYCKKFNKHKRETEKYSMIYDGNISQHVSVYKIEKE